MTYPHEFINAVKLSIKEDFYLGTGNPNAKILIIGKEAAIDMEKNIGQYENEFKKNARAWQANIENNIQLDNLRNCNGFDLNPLYPYKGQLNKVASFDKEGKIKRGIGGTSRTWYYYQKLTEGILDPLEKSAFINFHEHSFTTELNQVCGSYSHKIPRIDRLNSIQARQRLLRQNFFQHFPVIIVAVGHYVRDFQIDLQNLFEVRFKGERIDIDDNNWVNVHREIEGQQKKILLHTNQLSMINNDLIIKLSEICRNFIADHRLVI